MRSYLEQILDFPKQFGLENLRLLNASRLKSGREPDGLIFVGMGGSGLPATLFSGLREYANLRLPIVVWKSYGLPEHSFKNPLYIFISFSGNTEETLSGLRRLLKASANIAAIAGGGKLKKLAEKYRIPLVAFDGEDLTPRQALGKMYYAIIKILRVRLPSIKTSPNAKRINAEGLRGLQKTGKGLAQKLKGKIVLIYTDSAHSHLGYVWKTSLNETAKVPAFTNTIPEADHNEITAFESRRYPFAAIFLNNPKALSKVKTKMKLTEKTLAPIIKTVAIDVPGRDEEERNWNSIILSHLTSFYLAKINKINPRATHLIDKLKKLSGTSR